MRAGKQEKKLWVHGRRSIFKKKSERMVCDEKKTFQRKARTRRILSNKNATLS
jgi:hypothetical protein